MAVIAYKWGGIAFDDKSLIKTLILPSNAKDDVPITFHDNGTNYQVPGSKVFIVGKVMWALEDILYYGRVGESDTADGALTKEIIILTPHPTPPAWQYADILGVYSTGKWVTGETSGTSSGHELVAGCTLYGVEIDA